MSAYMVRLWPFGTNPFILPDGCPDLDLCLLPSQFNDVSQNYGADDCSLLSAAASLAWADPEMLKSLFKSLECGKDRNEGMVVRVSLFDFSQDDAPSREFSIPVTQSPESFIVDGQARDANSWSWTEGGPIWVGSKSSAGNGSRLNFKVADGGVSHRSSFRAHDWR